MQYTYRELIDQSKRNILRGIWKKRPTPFAKVCGDTAVDNSAMNELQSEGKVEIYSKQIKISKEVQKEEYFRWVPFYDKGTHVLVTPLLIKKV
jgi:hypothetical protein